MKPVGFIILASALILLVYFRIEYRHETEVDMLLNHTGDWALCTLLVLVGSMLFKGEDK